MREPWPFGPFTKGIVDGANEAIDLRGACRTARNMGLSGIGRFMVAPGTQLAMTLKDDQGTPANITSVLVITPFADWVLAVGHSTATDKFYLYRLESDFSGWYNSGGALQSNLTPEPVGTLWSSATDPAVIYVAEGLGTAYIAHSNAGVTYKTREYTVSGGLVDMSEDLSGEGAGDVYFRGVVSFNQHLWGWGHGHGTGTENDRPELLRFSGPFFAAFSSSDSMGVGHRVRSARETVVGAVVAGEVLFVGTPYGVWAIAGSGRDSWDKRPIDGAIGFAGGQAAVEGPEGYLYVWSRRGPMRMRSFANAEPLWDAVPNTIETISDPSTIVAVHDVDRDQILWVFANASNIVSGWEVESDDDGSGSEAAPDEGLLADGFIHRVSNAYELDWVGSGAVRKWYTTEFYSDNFEFSADVKRGASQALHGWPGIAFLVKDANNMCLITLRREDDDLVSIVFGRYDTGGDQDEVELEGDVALAYAAYIRLGVRIENGVATAFRADPITGDNEVSLGTLTIGADWTGDDDYNLMGVVQHQSSQATGVAWDNLTISSLSSVDTQSIIAAFDTRRQVFLGPDTDIDIGVACAGMVEPVDAPDPPAGPPTSPSTTGVGTTVAKAHWTDGDRTPGCVCTLEYRVQGGSVWTVAGEEIPVEPVYGNHYKITGLTHNTAYEWRVRHEKGGAASAYLGPNASTQFTTNEEVEGGGGGTPLQPPTDLDVTELRNPAGQGKTYLVASWTNSGESGVTHNLHVHGPDAVDPTDPPFATVYGLDTEISSVQIDVTDAWGWYYFAIRDEKDGNYSDYEPASGNVSYYIGEEE